MGVGIGVIGLGRIGRLHAANLAAHPDLRLAALADPYAADLATHAADLGARAVVDWRELLDDDAVDGLVICSPSDHHVPQIVAAAEAGKHAFCEKPIGLELSEIDAALDAVKRAGTVLQVGFNRRFDRNFVAMRRALDDGAVGRPWMVRITSRDPEPPPLDYLEGSGGLMLDMAIHDFDLARYLSGSEIVEVSTLAGALVDSGIADIGDVDTAVTSLRFAHGALGTIDNCRESSYGYDQRAEVHGSEGTVSAENEVEENTVLANASGFHRRVLPRFFLERYGAAYRRELESFAAAITGGPVLVDGRDGRAAVAAAHAAHRSLVERRPVALAEVEGGPAPLLP